MSYLVCMQGIFYNLKRVKNVPHLNSLQAMCVCDYTRGFELPLVCRVMNVLQLWFVCIRQVIAKDGEMLSVEQESHHYKRVS